MINRDKYSNFAELCQHERRGVDFEVIAVDRGSSIVVAAPHGGGIERGTTEIAAAVAGEEFSLYCFNGLKYRKNENLHITSTRFDEPEGLALLKRSHTVVSIHGRSDQNHCVWVGGLDQDLISRVLQALDRCGLHAWRDGSHISGSAQDNLCNQGTSGSGLQLEISEGLRRTMFASLSVRGRASTTPEFDRFTAAVRTVLSGANHNRR